MKISREIVKRINRLHVFATFDEWDESKHPRAENGQFDKSGGTHSEKREAEIGSFGQIYTEFRHDAQGAINKLMSEKSGEAIAALHHSELGDIDLIWGEEGDPNKDYRGGYGLAKIAKKHPEVLNDLQGVLDKMLVDKIRSGSYKARLKSEDGKYRGVVRLTYEGKDKKWLLTAFEKGVYVTSKTSDTASFSNVGDTALYIDINTTENIIEQRMMKFQQKKRIERLWQKCFLATAMDDRWITVKPNGEKGKGAPVKIDDEGRIIAGMGGKFKGEKIGEIRKSFNGPKTPQKETLETSKHLDKQVSNSRASATEINQRLEKLTHSLNKKNEKFDLMLQDHFHSVKEANGQPLNDKRNGASTLRKWDRQANALNRQSAEIEKTERAIEREKEIIAKVESTKLPAAINEAVQSGEITQWRKYPNRFFVKGVEKGRMIWDEKKGQLSFSHYHEIPEAQKPQFQKAFYELKAKLEGKTSEAIEKEENDKAKAIQDKKKADEEKRKALHKRISYLFKR